ncbi:MAG: radical SAM protein [Proteobacteria bacterium]|nr:radical SAM protein [Pseudomonadota bacterium]
MSLPSLKKVEIQLTTACNMSCGFCFANAGRNVTLPAELAKNVITQLAKPENGDAQEKSLWLTGGEALLSDSCKSLIEIAHGFGLKTGVATNGLLLARKAAALKAAGLQEVRVSLDAIKPSLFDQIRGTQKALPKVLAGLEAASKSGLRTGIRFTATKNNASELEPVIRQAQSIGAHHVEVKAVLPIGRAGASIMLPPVDLNNLMKAALSLSSPKMPVTVLCSYLSPCHGFELGKNHIPCICGTEALYVAVSGKIMPCSYFPQTSAINIRSHTLREAWESNDFARIREERPYKCKTCETWEPCRNGCPALLAHYSDYQTSCFGQVETLRRNKSYGNDVCIKG